MKHFSLDQHSPHPPAHCCFFYQTKGARKRFFWTFTPPPRPLRHHFFFSLKFIVDLDTIGGVERHVVASWSARKHHGTRSTEFFFAVHNHVVFKSCKCCPTWIFEKASGMYVVSNWIKSTPKTDGIVKADDLAASYICSPDSRPSLPPPLTPPLPFCPIGRDWPRMGLCNNSLRVAAFMRETGVLQKLSSPLPPPTGLSFLLVSFYLLPRSFLDINPTMTASA